MGTKHLTEADRLRARTLFFDAGLPKARICQITGFSLNQVKLAIREKTPKTRSGRPPRRRPGAAAAAAASGVSGETPIGIAQGADGSETLGEHGEHSEHGEDSSMMPVYSAAATPSPAVDEAGAASAHRAGDRVSSVHPYGQQHQQQQHHHQVQHQQQQQHQHQPQLQHHQQQQQPQQHYQQHGHHPTKWDTDYHSQQPYYSSWTQPAPGSPNSVQGGPQASATPASPPLPPPTASMRILPTVAPLGIPPPCSSAKSRGDFGVGSVGSVGSRDGRSSDGHDFSSSTSSSSLASSATSYSSMASSTSGGGFSLPSILASATGP